MFPKYTAVLLVVVVFITFAAADNPCVGSAFTMEFHCPDDSGKWFLRWGECSENLYLGPEHTVPCLKPGHAFNSRKECVETCKDEIENFVPPTRYGKSVTD